MKFQEQSLQEFSAHLAAREPVPGGGGAAALVGVLSAALASMVAQFTLGKQAYSNVEDAMKEYIEQLDNLRKQLLDLIDEDAQAFSSFDDVYALPKGSSERAQALQTAAVQALMPPSKMIEILFRVADLIERIEVEGSKMLASDVACAAYCVQAAAQSALINVHVNAVLLPEDAQERKDFALLQTRVNDVVVRMGACAARVVEGIHG